MITVLRPLDIQARLRVGKTAFWQNFVYDRERGGAQFIPGTHVPKLKLIPLGPRAIGGLEHEVEAMIEALAAERDRVPRRNK